MHRSAMLRMRWFAENYISTTERVKVLDVGSYDVNGSYRCIFDKSLNNVEYIGLDMSEGPNVDYVPIDPYNWSELEDESFDFVISANAFEHIEYPWLTISEIYKKLKTGGIACILAPNTIAEHRYPTDCYRYYSDGFCALAKWAGFKVIDVSVSGVPDENVPEEWYNEGINDALMIVGKGITDEEATKFPKMISEKRFYSYKQWERRYNFLKYLIKDEHPEKTMNDFFMDKKVQKVYLYGFGDVGKITYRYLKQVEGVEIKVIDKKGGIVENQNIITTGEKIDENEESCMLISVLVASITNDIEDVYPHIRKYFVDEIYEECVNI